MGNTPANPRPDAAEPSEDETPDVSPIAGASVDPLHALFNMDLAAAENITMTVDVPLVTGQVIPWTFGMIDQTMIEEVRERCTKWVRKPGSRKEKMQELDNARFNREIIVGATVKPDLTDPQLVAKFTPARNAAEMLDRFLKPGTIQKLGDQVLDFSGYDDEELVAEGKG